MWLAFFANAQKVVKTQTGNKVGKNITTVNIESIETQTEKFFVVRGYLLTTNEKPIVGALVSSNITNKKIHTDFDGSFNINVRAGSVVSIKYLTYKTIKFLVDKRKSDVIVKMLSDAQGHKGTVFTDFYGDSNNVNVKASDVQVMNEAQISEYSATTTEELINSGFFSGVQSNFESDFFAIDDNGENTAEILLDGIGVENDNANRPFIVIDGVEGSLLDVVPNDIKSITFLKDSSAAMYGADAANGVILIVTKNYNSSKVKSIWNKLFEVDKSNEKSLKVLFMLSKDTTEFYANSIAL